MEKRDLLHLMAFVWHRIEEDFKVREMMVVMS